MPPSCLISRRVGHLAAASGGNAAVPQSVEATPGLPSGSVLRPWWPGGPGAAPPLRSPGDQLGPPPNGFQALVLLLPCDGWENSRAAMAPSLVQRRAPLSLPSPLPIGFFVVVTAVMTAVGSPGTSYGRLPRRFTVCRPSWPSGQHLLPRCPCRPSPICLCLPGPLVSSRPAHNSKPSFIGRVTGTRLSSRLVLLSPIRIRRLSICTTFTARAPKLSTLVGS